MHRLGECAAHELDAAIIHILCFGPPPNGTFVEQSTHTAGYFSQLHVYLTQIVERVFRTEGAGCSSSGCAPRVSLRSYGDQPLSHYVRPSFTCPAAHNPACGRHARSLEWASRAVHASRYLTVSHAANLFFRPSAARPWPWRADRFDLAIHARRGDKLAVTGGAEQIGLPGEAVLARQAVAVLACVRAARSNRTRPSQPPVVLVASDDAAFAAGLKTALGRLDVSAELGGAHGASRQLPSGQGQGSTQCDESCVWPLQDLVEGFSRASALVLSLGSNVGGFMLTAWGARNGDAVPLFVDVDGRVRREDLGDRGARYFCRLEFGARSGLCEAGPDTGEPADEWPFEPPAARGEPLLTAAQAKEERKRRREATGHALKNLTHAQRQERYQAPLKALLVGAATRVVQACPPP